MGNLSQRVTWFRFPLAHSTHAPKFRFWLTAVKKPLQLQKSHCGRMFSWGEDCHRGFWLKHGPDASSTAEDGVHYLNLDYHIRDLSAGHNMLAFVKTNGNSFIIRTNQSKDGRRCRGKQKFVECKEKIQAVSCGDDIVTLLSERGTVFCVDRLCYTLRTPKALCNIAVSQVACGSQHSVALTKDGQVYTWGQGSRGQLGLGEGTFTDSSPQQLRALSAMPLVQIAAGGEQSFALSVSGGVFSWGRNDCGQLGLGDTTDRNTPSPVYCLNIKKATHVSCGKDHTAILTKDGVVFTFGSGQYGQLGHNSFRDELRPRIVAELWGAKVIKIACGRHHTLVLTDSKEVYSFGCRDQGQLGHGDMSNHSVPLPVELPEDRGEGPKLRSIFAGGNCSFATCTSNEEEHKESNNDSVSNVRQPSLQDMIDKWTAHCNSKSWKRAKQEIHSTFSSAPSWNKLFIEQSQDKHFYTSPQYPGLNFSLAHRAFKKLAKKADVLAEVEAAVLHLLKSINTKPVGVEGMRIYLLLNELLRVIQKRKGQQSTKLAEAVAAVLISLSAENLQVIGDWWSSLSPSTMVKYVKAWKQALSVILSTEPVPRNSGVKNLILVLQYMYNANSRIAESRRIPESDFCLVLDDNFLHNELLHWQSQHGIVSAEPLILCSFPIVMDLQSKKTVFDMNTEYIRRRAMTYNFYNFVWLFLPTFLTLELRRESVLEDTFEQLASAHHSKYKWPLMVCFDQMFAEDDANVYMKDFFHKVFHEMMSAESGMFMYNDSETLAWFPSNVTQEHHRYFLFGVLCGLALYNQCIIHLPFPLALFKKLLDVKPSLEDMLEFSPCVGKSLKGILEEKDGVMGNEDMYFLIWWDGTIVDLDPENPEKPVTSQNKKEFVDAYVNHAFNTSAKSVFQEFKRGFFQVCERDLVKLFRPEELRGVMVGRDFHNWEKLKLNTVYEGEYHVGHPTIQMFWEVFDELTEEQKKTFLWFVTGFDRVPILGMDLIKMNVKVKQVQDLSYDQYYPETHTCFSTLELPLYSTKEIMQTKLTEALSNNRMYK
ncbi:probable E3 ubiquitin-protein ligase HERC4 isoform X2 [Mastacembelus armatus]|uniref:probable E3 ubiquitin-protein ligase HERC4 isoform X2 n=1 Tax=Mastacembelus armatus TaxID=205130 RepID=UPI000E456FF6|nr:probable E3 ubiquitin-protein ligase HERC4 isoform X2 [Mastacembelus armatus]